MPRPSRWQQVVGALGIAVVVWAGSSVYDVATNGGSPTDRQAPTGGRQHDPSQFTHAPQGAGS